MDLRLHLHNPRPGRAEKDVHDVRLAELSVHQERVDQHCTGVLETLDRLKSTYQDMLFGHVQEVYSDPTCKFVQTTHDIKKRNL